MEFVSLNTIINDLLLIIRGSRIASSEPISERQLENWVHQYRALLLTREMDKDRYANPDYIQEITFLELSEVPIEGTELKENYPYYSSTGNILRSLLPIPKTVDLNFKSGFTYIGTPDGKELQLIPEGRSKWQEFRKYTPNDVMVFLKNRYLYLIGNTFGHSHLTVRGIFETPPEVARFINPATSKPYFDADSKYPMPIELIPAIKQLILEKELNIIVSTPNDNKIDSAHGVSQQVERA